MVDLKEWSLNYFKYRSSFDKFRVIDKGSFLELVYHDKKEKVFMVQNLRDFKIQSGFLVTLSSSKNITYLAENWESFIIPGLRIIFVRKDESKWAVNPYIHNRVADKTNLKKILKSMANGDK